MPMKQQNPGLPPAHDLTSKCHSTPRLDVLVSMARPSYVLADIGCDHAYLSILLIRGGAADHVIASDISDGPLAKAAHNVARFGMDVQIELRKGDGLSALQPGEADTIVIAGLGGNVISGILEAGQQVARKVDKLLLQPMSASEHLRRFLYENGYTIVREVLAKEDRRFYSILQVENRPTPAFRSFDCYFSPALFSENRELLGDYLRKRKRELASIAEGLERSRARRAEAGHYRSILEELSELTIDYDSNPGGNTK